MKRLPEIIAVTLLILFFFVRIPSNRYNQVVHSDGKGYYAHLPAIFIYHDLEYNFADAIEKKYYPEDGSMAKHFRFNFKGEIVNKTFSGITILWLPFFLIAHLLSYIFGYDLDGYSLLYQLSIGLSAIFYCWLGCKFLLKLLQSFSIPNRISGFVTVLSIFGSNYLYYVLCDPSLTHTYNFTIIVAFLYFIKKYAEDKNDKNFIFASLLFALILTIRPQNGFILFVTPFFFGSLKNLKSSILHLLSGFKTLIISILGFLAIIAVPITLWYLQTGYFLVYSYGEEKFVFSNPQFFNVLFSYQKGLFIYTPLIFISLFGLWKIFSLNKFQFISLCLFFIINTYIIASWEEWWYGCSFGHRVFIDFYGINALLLGIFLKSIDLKTWLKYVIHFVLILTMFLNLFQSYQHYTSIVPSCFNNSELYWHNFLRIRPEARGRIDDDATVIVESVNDSKNENQFWQNTDDSKSNGPSQQNTLTSEIGVKSKFSNTFSYPLSGNEKLVLIAASIKASDNLEPKLVVDTRDSSGNSIDYQLVELNRYINDNEWINGQWKFSIDSVKNHRKLLVYFWQPQLNGASLIKDFSVKLYSTK